MTARVDATDFSVVVYCPACPSFAEMARDKDDGHRRAANHDRGVHPGVRSAQDNYRRWQLRNEKPAQLAS